MPATLYLPKEGDGVTISCLAAGRGGHRAVGAVSYVVGSKSFRSDQLFKETEIKQICYFST